MVWINGAAKNALVNTLLADPDTLQRLRQAGHEVQAMTAQEFDAYVARDQERWRAVVRTRKIALQLDSVSSVKLPAQNNGARFVLSL